MRRKHLNSKRLRLRNEAKVNEMEDIERDMMETQPELGTNSPQIAGNIPSGDELKKLRDMAGKYRIDTEKFIVTLEDIARGDSQDAAVLELTSWASEVIDLIGTINIKLREL